MDYTWDFSVIWQAMPLLLKGLWMTIRLAAVSVSLGLVIGLIVGLMALSVFRPFRWIANIYIELFRNIPGIVQLFWFYYTIPILTGWQGSPFVTASIALTVYNAAYCAEIYRAGIKSVHSGQWEGARALGLGRTDMMRYVILPQAVRRMIPALTNRVMETIKTTTLASTIALGELLYTAKLVAENAMRPLEAYTAVALFFAAVLIPVSYLSIRLERRGNNSKRPRS